MDAPSLSRAPVALCLGGMDPSAGAGLLRDAAVCQELGVHAMAVSTAETVQNGLGCLRILPPLLDPVEPLACLAPHLREAWGVKLGLCALDPPALRRLADALEDLAPPVRIWDPILAPSLGAPLHDPDGLRSMADLLLARGAWVAAPNLREACAAAGLGPEADPAALARPFLERGARAVWLKGGHREGARVEDLWIDAGGVEGLGARPRQPGERRGTGCTAAAAWLCHRLRGAGDRAAARAAADHVQARWQPGFRPGDAGRPMFAPAGAP